LDRGLAWTALGVAHQLGDVVIMLIFKEEVLDNWPAVDDTDQCLAGGSGGKLRWHTRVLGAAWSGQEQIRMFSGRTFRPHRLVVDATSLCAVDFLEPMLRGMPGLTSLSILMTT
jgi:hypothetical protein